MPTVTQTVSQPLLIISRDALLEAREHSAVFRHLASLTRRGWHLLLTAPEPDQWFPTRSSDDNVLTAQGRLQGQIQACGGEVDGVYYVPRSEFTQDRNRLGALRDILARYGAEPGNARLISSSLAFVQAGKRLGLLTEALEEGEPGAKALEALLHTLASEPGQGA
jgi:hypothetical protein